MTAYAIFDVEIYDMERYQEFMRRVKPARDIWRAAALIGSMKAIGFRAASSFSNFLLSRLSTVSITAPPTGN